MFTEHAENQQAYVPASLSVTFDGGDVTACASATLTDTTPGTLHADTCCPEDYPGTSVPGVHDAERNVMVWNMGDVAPGGVVRAGVLLHSFTTITSGRTLASTFTYTSDRLTVPGTEGLGLLASAARCDAPVAPTETPMPTATPTPTSTPRPHPTRGTQRMWLPMIMRE